jgi:hypothetical protein
VARGTLLEHRPDREEEGGQQAQRDDDQHGAYIGLAADYTTARLGRDGRQGETRAGIALI